MFKPSLFTIIVLGEGQPEAVLELIDHGDDGTEVQTFHMDQLVGVALAAVLMVAAAAHVQPHQRVKLLAMAAEIQEVLDFDANAAWTPGED